MPEPLDLRWWDTVRGAVQGLSAASLDSPGLLRGNCLFSNLWLHIYHQRECEVLIKSILLDASKDGVDS